MTDISKCRAYLAEINRQREIDGEEPLVESHILTKHNHPESTILVAMSEGYEDAYIYHPLSENEQPYNPHYAEPDEILLGYLEDGYQIEKMDMKTHAALWNYISDMNTVECKDGLKKYLEYCVKKDVSLDALKSRFDYKFYDLMAMYQTNVREDIFLRMDSFKEKPWYDDIVLYSRLGVCKPKVQNAKAVCKALRELGYSVQMKMRDGDLYVLPIGRNKNEKETEAR